MARPTNIKLKIRSRSAAGTIFVFQDGTAADPDATAGRQYNNAFRFGASPSGTTDQWSKAWIELDSLEQNYQSGKSLRFRVIGQKAWLNDPAGVIQLQPNDEVELWWDRTTQDTSVVCSSWHMNQASSGQRRQFYGFVDSVEAQPDGGLSITCQDPLWKANDIKAERDTSGGIPIPKIAFNLEIDAPDWFYSIKITNPGSGTPWGTGEAQATASTMTVRQILEYLDSRYYSRLVTDHVIDSGTASTIFNSSDIAALTFIPPPMTFENIGFAQLVREVLKWAPDMDLVVDHQTTQWRLVRTGINVKSTATTTTSAITSAAGPYFSKVSVSDPSLFSASPGVTGNRVRIYSTGNPALNLERTIYAIVGSELRFREYTPTGGGGFGSGSRIVPIDGTALPSRTMSVDRCPKGMPKLRLDLDRVYSAVKFYSVNQTTVTETVPWNATDLSGGTLQPGWKTGYESVWDDKDKDRESDFGSDGRGLKVYKIDNDGTYDRLYIRGTDSAFGTNVAADEWKGCTVHVWTINGADARNQDKTFRIRANAWVSDVGDGSPGLRVALDCGPGAFLAAVVGFKTVNDPSSTEDRVCLTQDMRFQNVVSVSGLPAENNARWEVGRKWYFTGTTIRFDASGAPHTSVCTPAKLQVDDGTGNFRRVAVMTSQLGYPSRNQNTAGPWVQVAGGGPGSFQIYRRNSFYTRTPAATPCPMGYQPPRLVQVEYERTTTTFRSARFPASGYAGVAFERFNLAREWSVAVTDWTEDNQTADYATMAERFWGTFSMAHQRGTVTVPDIQDHATFLDLGIMVNLTTSVAVQTQQSMVLGFWGTATSVSIDFQGDAVTIEFDNANKLEELRELYEKMTVQIAAKVEDLAAQLKKINELPKCLAGSQLGETPTGLCAEVVYEPGGTSILPKLRTQSKDNQAIHSTATSYDFSGAW